MLGQSGMIWLRCVSNPEGNPMCFISSNIFMKKLLFLAAILQVCSIAKAQLLVNYSDNAGQDVVLQAIIPVDESYLSNLYVAGTIGEDILVGEVDQNGTQIWLRTVNADMVHGVVNSMIIDSEGHMVVCGSDFTGVDDDGEGFVLRFDPVAKETIWFKKATQNVLFFDVQELLPGGDFVVGGEDEYIGAGTGADHLLMQVSRSTGDLSVISNLDEGVNENVDALVVDSDSGYIYSVGRYEINFGGVNAFRMALRKTDVSGDVLWSKYYLEPTAVDARFYPKDLVLFDGALYIVGCGDEEGASSLKNLFVFKTDLNGNLDFAKKLDLSGTATDGILAAIKPTPVGFMLYGSLYDGVWSDVFLALATFDFDINWINSYPFAKTPGAYGIHNSSSLAIISQRAFQVGVNLDESPQQGVFATVEISSGLLGDCEAAEEISVTDYVDAYESPFLSDEVTGGLVFEDVAASVSVLTLVPDTICLVPSTVSIQQLSEPMKVSVFPNPADEAVQIHVSAVNNTALLEVFDVTGKCMVEDKAFDGYSVIHTGNWPAGVYNIVLHYDAWTVCEQFIVK